MSPQKRITAESAVARCIRFRYRAWSNVWSPRAFVVRSLASPVDWIRPKLYSSAPKPWISSDIHAPISSAVPCVAFATSERTLGQARRLMNIIGCEAREIDIRPSCAQMFQDIGHPYAKGSDVFDVTFENVQAGERTSHLFRLANLHNGLVVGTSDLSELALGWCTYGVGDQMSHYGVNVSMPKTLVAHVIRWIAAKEIYGKDTSAVLHSILDTASSPELIPGQETESTIGPFELHDFFLYYTLRFGYSPTKVAFLYYCAWRDAASGQWPDIPLEK